MPRSNSSGPSRRRSGPSKGKSFGKSSGGDATGKPFKKSTRKPFSGDSSERPFKKSFGSARFDDKKSEGDKPARGRFGDKKESSGGERKSYGPKKFSRPSSDKPFGERKAPRGRFGDKKESSGDERKSYGPKKFSRPSSDKPFGERKAPRGRFGDKKESSGDERRSYGPKKFSRPSSDKPFGERKASRGRFGDKKESSGDERKSYGPKKFSRSSSSEDKPFKRKRNDDFKKDDSRSDNTERRKPSQLSNPNYGRPFKRKSYDKKSDDTRSENHDEAPEKRGFFSSGKGKAKPSAKDSSNPSEEGPVQDKKIRLNKFIANSGVCSRREADELITMGLISVNGKTITELGYKVNPGDEVRHENKVLRAEKPVYILMNKPKGFLTTTTDPQERNTVMHIIGNAVKERIYPVGRLDRNTTGLLLFTNDGDLAEKLMHPSYNVKKIYKVELDRPLAKADFEKIAEGIHLEEGKAVVDDMAIISDDGRTVGIEIHIGWNRVVRRIFEALEYSVIKLDRSVYAGLDKKDLSRGHWRFLTQEEIVRLKHYK
jgi:23S rRNA pseudouridine2605 synthase